MPYAWKLTRKTEDGADLCITDGSKSFWEDVDEGTTIVSWEWEDAE